MKLLLLSLNLAFLLFGTVLANAFAARWDVAVVRGRLTELSDAGALETTGARAVAIGAWPDANPDDPFLLTRWFIAENSRGQLVTALRGVTGFNAFCIGVIMVVDWRKRKRGRLAINREEGHAPYSGTSSIS